MRRLRKTLVWMCALAGCSAALWAQAPSGAGAGQAAGSSSEALTRLTPPSPKSPVDSFRNVLAMTPVERREFLEKRPPEAQKVILEKVQEYQGLRPEERELRLRVTELRWYLMPLLNTPATNRAAQFSTIPIELRPLIEARVREWDKLSTAAQQELLDNESTVRFYFELAARPAEQRSATMTNLPAAVVEQRESGLRRWQSLTQTQREAIVDHFREYFELTAAEKERTLLTLSEPERVQIEKTLRTFEGLTPQQRAQCLRSFQKFANLTPAERQQFLRNAERWERMTPSERQTWRSLVSNLSRQPPAPPGFAAPSLPSPPAPRSGGGQNSWATNSN
jgi:hypothetical protein